MTRSAARLVIVLVLFSAGLGAARMAAGAVTGQPCAPDAVKHGNTCSTGTSTSATTTTSATTATVSTASTSTASTSTKTSGSKGGRKTAAASVLSLQSESIQNNFNSPPWCLNEDDYHRRIWSGSFSGTFSLTEYFCTLGVDYYGGTDWDGGGLGLILDLVAVGRLDTLTLSNPGAARNPALTVNAELIGTQLVGQGGTAVTQNHYVACAFLDGKNLPMYSPTTYFGPWQGTWTATASGDFSQANVTVTAIMGYRDWVAMYCPADMQLR